MPSDPFLAAGPSLPPPLSDRMRKRRAFADKELESIMLEREYKERRLLESGRASPLLFANQAARRAVDYNAYKAAYSPAAAAAADLCPGPARLDAPAPYPPAGDNGDLVPSGAGVAYRHYPRGGFVVWPRAAAAAANLGDALLYRQCLFNAAAADNSKPWEPEAAAAEEDAASSRDPLRAAPESAGAAGENSAFYPPKRRFGHAFPARDAAKLSLDVNCGFRSLLQHSLGDGGGGGGAAPYCKELLQEAARKLRESKTADRCAKDFLSEPGGAKMAAGESLSFSVEAILNRPAMSRAFH